MAFSSIIYGEMRRKPRWLLQKDIVTLTSPRATFAFCFFCMHAEIRLPAPNGNTPNPHVRHKPAPRRPRPLQVPRLPHRRRPTVPRLRRVRQVQLHQPPHPAPTLKSPLPVNLRDGDGFGRRNVTSYAPATTSGAPSPRAGTATDPPYSRSASKDHLGQPLHSGHGGHRRRFHPRASAPGARRRKGERPPASRESIEALPSVEVEEGCGDLECVVCLEEFGVGGVAKKMPCKHKFHSGCIEKWLGIHGSCPVCRYEMPVPSSFCVSWWRFSFFIVDFDLLRFGIGSSLCYHPTHTNT
ncbi:hypothetical protein Fmac_020316 [Flemingia macrophylla]|uniref:RING-type E3 ubiquitin transferase n=1 Tax=Flemingia macrophylla TaxID=520843 RepID=A0ABD1LTN7_9FABA